MTGGYKRKRGGRRGSTFALGGRHRRFEPAGCSRGVASRRPSSGGDVRSEQSAPRRSQGRDIRRAGLVGAPGAWGRVVVLARVAGDARPRRRPAAVGRGRGPVGGVGSGRGRGEQPLRLAVVENLVEGPEDVPVCRYVSVGILGGIDTPVAAVTGPQMLCLVQAQVRPAIAADQRGLRRRHEPTLNAVTPTRRPLSCPVCGSGRVAVRQSDGSWRCEDCGAGSQQSPFERGSLALALGAKSSRSDDRDEDRYNCEPFNAVLSRRQFRFAPDVVGGVGVVGGGCRAERLPAAHRGARVGMPGDVGRHQPNRSGQHENGDPDRNPSGRLEQALLRARHRMSVGAAARDGRP